MALETPPLTKVTACTTTEATIEKYILTPKDGFNLTNIPLIFVLNEHSHPIVSSNFSFT